MKALAVFILVFFRRYVSPFLPRVCRFYPSCSAYALESIELYGPIGGTARAFKRLARCHPFSIGGIDPVIRESRSADHVNTFSQ